MADLIRTDDADAMEDPDDEEGDDLQEGGATMMTRGVKKKKGGFTGFTFGDLDSDDEVMPEAVPLTKKDSGVEGWDFDVQQDTADPGAECDTTLEEKIKARLEEKRANQGEDAAHDEMKPKSGDTDSARQPQAAKPPPDLSHLHTGIHFADLRLSRPLLRAVTDLKFETPTPIQRDVIPPALKGVDVLATAETGSGKTASFLLPTLERLCQSASVRGRKRDSSGRVVSGPVATKAMILIPTRELAVQCQSMLRDLSKYTMVTHELVIGGFVQQDQARSLRSQPDIVVATPGRILDHLINSQSVHMELLEIVIFDEADRLLELGFEEECNQVLKRCSRGRQTMLFSATMSVPVEKLAGLALVKPVRIHSNPVNRVTETLEQEFVKAPSEDAREAVLMSLVERNYMTRVIIFCATKHAAHRLAIIFGLCGKRFAEIHGNLSQGERQRSLQRFQKGEADYLLATDLAARGLDLCNVETVVNFHLPLDVSRYIHRVGRTARMGRAGRAVTVYTSEEYAKVKLLGKQCRSKVKSTVLKRTVAPAAVEQWVEKLSGLTDDINAIREDESLERELRLADMYTGKSDNMQKHKADIHSRPAKTWYISNNEKRELRSTDAEQRQKESDSTAAAAAEADEAAAAASSRSKNKKGKKPYEEPEVRRKRIARERFLEKKRTANAEKEMAHRKMRASARRSRKSERPTKGFEDHEKDKIKKKGKKGKGKR